MTRIADAWGTVLPGALRATSRRIGGQLLWLVLVLCLVARGSEAQGPFAAQTVSQASPPGAAITPIPAPPAADPRRLAIGEALFGDDRLSHNGAISCASCHDLHTNGAADQRTLARLGAKSRFTVLTVFNAALDFRLNWEGNYRTLEAQAASSLENPANMASGAAEASRRLRADPVMVERFRAAYGHPPDGASLLDALATFERSLLTPDSRFDAFLRGDDTALTQQERHGYELFQSLGCISCHQGVNIGGNLYERHGIFHPLASPQPEILRVPSLRNVALLAPYFHDGSAPTLDDAVRKMARAQLDQTLPSDDVASIVAFLKTLTGKFRGVPLTVPP